MKVISLGAGVQSSCVLALADLGVIEADCAIFADTQAEPKAVYDWLEFLKSKSSIPIHVISKGDIIADTMAPHSRSASVPFFVKNPDGSQGIGRRQCTSEYKIQPIIKHVRTLLGYAPRKRVKHRVDMIMGISIDEIYRVKPSRVPWITNKYPLIELKKDRQWCIQTVKDYWGKTPPRSACWMCPYRSDDEWIALRDGHSEEFQKAVYFDRFIRKQAKWNGENYLHRSMKPLDQVEFKAKDRSQTDMFNNECEGVCGV